MASDEELVDYMCLEIRRISNSTKGLEAVSSNWLQRQFVAVLSEVARTRHQKPSSEA